MPGAPTLEKIRLVRLAHVNYAHANMKKARQFLEDFGLQEVEERDGIFFYRGYGTEPFVYSATRAADSNAFLGAGFVVETLRDLELASETLPGATSIHELDAPGGGKRVTFYDPVDKFPVHLVHGQRETGILADYPELPSNYPFAKHRPVNAFKRLRAEPRLCINLVTLAAASETLPQLSASIRRGST